MSRSHARVRPSRLRLTTALAVTLATAAVAVPGVATAAPAAVGQERTAEAALPVLDTSDRVDSVGSTGFLTSDHYVADWWRYDGTSTPLPSDGGYTRYRGASETDIVVGSKGTRHTVQDMAKGGDPVVVDTPDSYKLRQVNGSTLVMDDTATDTLHLVSREPGGQTVDRRVTGLPSGKLWIVSPTAPGTVAVQLVNADFSAYRLAVVDVATAAVTQTYDLGGYAYDVQVTPGHVTWQFGDGGTKVIDRHTGATEVLPHWVSFAFGDDWHVIREDTRLTFRSLKDGHTVEPFRFANQVTPGPGGTLLVRGGTVADGWGVFRVALDAAGEPTVTMVGDIPDAPELTLKSLTVPSRITSFAYKSARFAWEFNEEWASVRFDLTHTATGRTVRLDNEMNPFLDWDGNLGNSFGAYNGTYTWKMTATSEQRFGPAVVRTGSLTVARPAQPRDFNDDGGADALVRDSSGNLSAYGIGQLTAMKEVECYDAGCSPTVTKPDPERLGTGWNTYTLMTSPGNVAGGVADDIVGRDRDGVLWLHQSEKQKLLPRTKIGAGWQVYNKITGGSDLNADGRGDLLATDTSGVLWFYASTGDAAKPFKPRVRIGGGWQVYNLLTAPGNIAGATGGDLLARDKDGVLWLYLGKGDGTFTARRQIGGGWQKYTHIIPAGMNYSYGVADLYAIGPAGSATYTGTNSTTRPFAPAYTLPLRTDSTTYKTFF
ncbi:hypothetical protein AB0K02_20275 [Streptomyces sp. NPDC049597]|uniref:hypothetical protein n=1 Tax=Streptomyces sp. NPDC049597 TaxID=3155276 RepID=UPI00342546BF